MVASATRVSRTSEVLPTLLTMHGDPQRRNPQPAVSTGLFATLLRGYRRATGLTQEEFAAKAGVGVRTLRDLERGRARPQRATVDLLAAALGLRGAARDEFVATARRGAEGAQAPQPVNL